MRLSIIPCDKAVYIDGVAYLDIDMTWVPDIEGKEVHAVQWSNDVGEVEFVGNFENLKIEKLGVFEKAIKLWDAKKLETDKLEQQRLEEEERLIMEQEEQKKAELEMFLQFELEAKELEAQARDFEKQRLELEEAAAAVARELEETAAMARELEAAQAAADEAAAALARELEAAAAATAAALKAEEEYKRSIPAAIFEDEVEELSEGKGEIVTEDSDRDEDLFFDIEELLREI